MSLRFGFRVVISAYKRWLVRSLPPVVCKRAHVLLTLFVFACGEWFPTHIVFVFCLFCLVFILCLL
ncbi:hypothetical protein BAZSYMB_GCONTIG00584_0 [Bathymodiolus azoricus thioautotrophic gill symbiont]|uniref:Uncharacterized protein n=1 Tax=Bathymodiolus azoricus thioautotrophic gill symbiont TaxID=235205 RepID=A0A1H6L8J3_9GAMM|nr:hypothetical protein BAZSYMB_GCONTIG00584_0 [Bathymodiolus azoricus thioautotrophic gill symbiont]